MDNRSSGPPGASPQRPADPPLFRGPERRSASRTYLRMCIYIEREREIDRERER